MGTIKDLTDLVTQYIDSVDDRKFASELRDIQKMIILIQREQSVLQEQNAKLQSENIKLQKQAAFSDTSGRKNKPKNTNEPSEDMLNVLHYCSECNEGASTGMVQNKFQFSSAKAELLLGKLSEEELIDYGSLIMGQDIQYVPTQEGLELLDENDLI